MTELEPAVQGERRPIARRRARWPWLIAGVAFAVVKAQGWTEVGHHPVALIPVLAVVLLASLLRPRPVIVALCAGALAALVVAPHPLLAGIGFAVGVFVLVMLVFLALATVLHARQRRGRGR